MRGLVQAGVFLFLIASKLSFAQSKIVLTSRSFHPKDETDRLNTQEAYHSFRAEQIDWMYCTDDRKLMSLRSDGITYSLAINPQVPDSLQYTTVKTRMVDINGRPYIAPWMKAWHVKNPYWGCVNNPKFRQLFFSKCRELIDLGAYGIFVDDAKFNDHANAWGGGCFCNYCLEGFDSYLSKIGDYFKDDFANRYSAETTSKIEFLKRYKKYYAGYQHASVISFLNEWRSEMKGYSKGNVTLLTNNVQGSWDTLYRVFDGGIAELNERSSSFSNVTRIIETARKLGKQQAFSYASDDIDANIGLYLFCYLNGCEAVIPWDLYTGVNNGLQKPRLYISPSEMLPIIDFIKRYREEFSHLANYKGLQYAQYSAILYSKDGSEFLILLNDKGKGIETKGLLKIYSPVVHGTKHDSSYDGFVILKRKQG